MPKKAEHCRKGIHSALARKLYSIPLAFGIDPLKMLAAVAGTPRFVRTVFAYRRQHSAHTPFPLRWGNISPHLGDERETAGRIDAHYFYQDLWAARKIHAHRPAEHLDIGSRIDGFIAHLLCFMPVTVVDIRPMVDEVTGLTFIQGDATDLRHFGDSTVPSLSCLHAVEHFGLGRYGDPVNPTSPFQALHSFERVLSPGGRLYLGVPIGAERLEFNAHRIFSPATIVGALSALRLLSFSAVDDRGRYHENVDPEDYSALEYGCGLFELTK